MGTDLLALVVEGTIATSLAVVLVLLARRPLRAAFGARIAYVAWGLVPAALVAVLLPAAAVPVVALEEVRVGVVSVAAPLAVVPAFDVRPWLAVAWALGVALSALAFAWQQHRFVRGLGRLVPREDGSLQAEAVAGLPAAIGILRPRIVLPADYALRYSDEQQRLLAAHERTHIARGDLQLNAFAVLLRCLFWFNPLLHLAARRFRHDQELACDARVIGRFPQARRAYGEAMFNTQLAGEALPLGCHWGSTHPLRERIDMLGKPAPSTSRRIAGTALVLGLAIATGYAAWAAQPAGATAAAATAAAIPAGHVRARIDLRIDEAAATSHEVVERAGNPFTIAVDDGGHAWRLTAAVRPLGDGRLDLKAVVTKDGATVASPRLVVESGKQAAISVGKQSPQGFEGVHLEVLISAADGATAVPAEAAVPAEVALAADGPQVGDVPAQGIRLLPAKYPKAALAQGISGHVVLHLDIGADGVPTNAEVVESSPPGVFDAACLAAVKQWRFAPARRGGKAVASRIRVPMEFDAKRKRDTGALEVEVEPVQG